MKVNALNIGAGKSGTTSLYYYLKQHKDIFFSDAKEVGYFTRDHLYEQGLEYYHSFFTQYNNQKIIMSADTHLLSSEKAPQRVYEYNPDMKLIAILRHPVDRAYSAYNFAIKNGFESPQNSFIKTMELEPERLKNCSEEKKVDLGYFYYGLYYMHLSRWLKYFPKKNFLLLDYKEFQNTPDITLRKIFEFLEIDVNQKIDTSKQYNKAGRVRSKWLHNFLINRELKVKKFLRKLLPNRIRSFIRSKVVPNLRELNSINEEYRKLTQEERKIVGAYFKDDLKQLEIEFGIKI